MKIAGIVFFGLFGLRAYAQQTIYAGIDIPDECKDSYVEGVETFNGAVRRNLDPEIRRSYFDQMLKEIPEPCQVTFSMGLFDGKHVFLQKLVLEYGLEIKLHRERNYSSHHLRAVEGEFRKRFNGFGFSKEVVDRLAPGSVFYEQELSTFIDSMKALAEEKGAAVPFGRFVFPPGKGMTYLTLYEVERDQWGVAKKDEKGELVLKRGSYQRLAEKTWVRMVSTARAYLEWKPSIYFGTDSFWFGAVRRWWYKDKGPSIRENDERIFEERLHRQYSYARRLGLKIEPFVKIYQQVIKKKRAYLERDIKVYERTKFALYSAPVIPVAMAVGASGLAYAGLAALPPGTASFTFAASTFYSAANVSALVTGSVLGGFAGLGLYQGVASELEDELPFRFARVMDKVIGMTVQSFPLASLAPVAIGGTAAGVKYLSVAVPAFVQAGMDLWTAGRALGIKGAFAKTPGLIGQGVKWWATTWWKNKRVLGFQYLGNGLTLLGFEIYSREFVLGGNFGFFPRNASGEIQWFNWSEYNKQSLVSLGASGIGGFLFQPAMMMKSVIGRSVYAQSITMVSIAMTTMLMDGEVDFDRIKFESYYSLMWSRWRAEAIRPVLLSNFVTGHSGARQTALTILINVLVGTLESPVRNYLLDEYMNRGVTPAAKIRELAFEHSLIDLEGFSDIEIDAAFEVWIHDPRNSETLGQIMQEMKAEGILTGPLNE